MGLSKILIEEGDRERECLMTRGFYESRSRSSRPKHTYRRVNRACKNLEVFMYVRDFAGGCRQPDDEGAASGHEQ